MFDDRSFMLVRLNSRVPGPCSPVAPEPYWRGVLIRAPRKAPFQPIAADTPGEFVAVPICGYYQVDAVATPIREPMRLLAVSKQSRKVYVGEVRDRDRKPVERPPKTVPITLEEIEGEAEGSYFNLNLFDWVTLPEGPGCYTIQVEFRGYRSNAITIELI